MRLHVVYRSALVENNAPRPPYYSKDACLGSFLSTLKTPGLPLGDVLFVNDDVIRGARGKAMEAHGEILELPKVGNAASYRAVLSLPDWRGWSDDDLVYFVEDDYLHVREALPRLLEAADHLGQAAFFTLYRHPDYFVRSEHLRYRRRTSARATTVGDTRWEPCWGTPLTFAARVSRFRAVAGIHALAARGKHPNDIAMWKATQRVGWHRLIHLYATQSRLTDLEAVASGAVELVTRRSRKLNLLMFPTPTLATHVHEPFIAEGRQWEQLSAEGLAELS
jgi:hypothetical protein